MPGRLENAAIEIPLSVFLLRTSSKKLRNLDGKARPTDTVFCMLRGAIVYFVESVGRVRFGREIDLYVDLPLFDASVVVRSSPSLTRSIAEFARRFDNSEPVNQRVGYVIPSPL